MAVKIVVFDFDGTLIDSNQLKYDAYFSLFSGDAYPIDLIKGVLAEMYEESRYVIIEEILCRKGEEATSRDLLVPKLADKYNDIVLAGAKTCPEKPEAEDVLRVLSPHYRLYVSSTTPETALLEIILAREWQGYFVGTFGYPRHKSQTLRDIMQTEQVGASELVVVGDGESDRLSAAECGCHFIRVAEDFVLKEIPELLQLI